MTPSPSGKNPVTGGHGRSREFAGLLTPSPVAISLSAAEKKSPSSQDGITFAVKDFLAGLRLTGSERVLAALAIALAEAMDAAPGYAKGKIAHELREVLEVLAKAEMSPANLALLAGIEQ